MSNRAMARLSLNGQNRARSMRKRYRSTRDCLLYGMGVKLVVSRMVLKQVFVSKLFKKIFSSVFLQCLGRG